MKKLLAALFCLTWVFAIGCGGKQKPNYTDEKADAEVEQLIKLYMEARPKFVVQKQNMIQDGDCARASALKGAIDRKAEAAAMSTENTETITKVHMELTQAEKDCKAK